MNGWSMRVWHLLVLVAACAGFLAVFQYRREVYDPTAARIRQVRYADTAGKVAAIRALVENEASGHAVVEALLGALTDADPAVRAAAPLAMAAIIERDAASAKPDEALAGAVKAALAQALSDPDPTVRLRAAIGLAMLRVKSDESFVILVQAAMTAGRPEDRFRSAGDPDDRAASLWALAFAYRDEPAALGPILKAMEDRDPSARGAGLVAINCYLRRSDGDWYRRPPDFTVPEPIAVALLARLEDADDGVRRRAAEVVGRLGPKMARRAVPVLVRTLNRADPHSSSPPVWAAVALRDFGLEADEARPALRALAADSSRAEAVRVAMQQAAEAIDTLARAFHEKTLPHLIAQLGDDDPENRAAAAAALGRHGARAKAAVPPLTRALDDPQPEVRRAAAAGLEAIENALAERNEQPRG